MKRLSFSFLVILLFTGSGLSLWALEEPPVAVVDFPLSNAQIQPEWLGRPNVLTQAFASVRLPLHAYDERMSLLVTVYFQEKEGGFLRASWQDAQGAQVISDNLYEGIGLANQRSFFLEASTFHGQGTLSFQSGDTTLGIYRIKLQWLASQTHWVSPMEQDVLVTNDLQKTDKASNLTGQPNPSAPISWQQQKVTVLVTETPQRVEKGVEFNLQLDQSPHAARLHLEENGLELGQYLVIWVNQQRAGVISLETPDLADPGYLSDLNGKQVYLGWRKGSFYLPLELLKPGLNTLQFSPEDGQIFNPNPPTTHEVTWALKEVKVQFDYPTLPPVAPAESEAIQPTTAIPQPPVTP